MPSESFDLQKTTEWVNEYPSINKQMVPDKIGAALKERTVSNLPIVTSDFS